MSFDDIDAATLGNIDVDKVDEPQLKWTHFLYQVASAGQPIASPSPAIRFLGFCNSETEAKARKRHIENCGVRGLIHIGTHEDPFVVVAKTDEHISPKGKAYQARRRKEITQQFIDEEKYKANIFRLDQIDKLRHNAGIEARKEALAKGLPVTRILDDVDEEDKKLTKRLMEMRKTALAQGLPLPEECNQLPLHNLNKIDRENEYILRFNRLPWVKAKRREYRVDDDILVKRGAAMAAVHDTIAMYRDYAHRPVVPENKDDEPGLGLSLTEAEKWATKKMMEPRKDDLPPLEQEMQKVAAKAQVSESELQERMEQGNAEFPDTAKKSGQGMLLFSYVLDESEEMEPMIIVYGYCEATNVQKGKSVLCDTVVDFIAPLSSSIYPLYEWMQPYDFGWFENSLEAKNCETDYSASDKRVGQMQQGRRIAQQMAADKLSELRADERKNDTSVGRVMQVLEITEAQWNDAVQRIGIESIHQTLFSLPSLADEVSAMRERAKDGAVLMSDVFNKKRKLTAEDREIVRKLFRPLTQQQLQQDFTPLLDSLLDE